METIAKGEADLIIGTHALIQDGVDYARLGLIIIDEQHRFGVGQRRVLREKGDNPDVLMMTATPIPRTLAITAFWRYGCFHYRSNASRAEAYCNALDQT